MTLNDFWNEVEEIDIASKIKFSVNGKMYDYAGLNQVCNSEFEGVVIILADDEHFAPKEKYKEQKDRPPVGIMPRWLHREKRTNEIIAAMKRYNEFGKKIPAEWFIELCELFAEIRMNGGNE